MFSWKFYLFLYPELSTHLGISTRADAEKHWENVGRREGKIGYDSDNLHDNWRTYLKKNKYLLAKNIRDKRNAILHWYTVGKLHKFPLQSLNTTLRRLKFHKPYHNKDTYKKVFDQLKPCTVVGLTEYDSYRDHEARQQETVNALLHKASQLQREENILENKASKLRLQIQQQEAKIQKVKTEMESHRRRAELLKREQQLQELEQQQQQQLENQKELKSTNQVFVNNVNLNHGPLSSTQSGLVLLPPTCRLEYTQNMSKQHLLFLCNYYSSVSSKVVLHCPLDPEMLFYAAYLEAEFQVRVRALLKKSETRLTITSETSETSDTSYNYVATLSAQYVVSKHFFATPQLRVVFRKGLQNRIEPIGLQGAVNTGSVMKFIEPITYSPFYSLHLPRLHQMTVSYTRKVTPLNYVDSEAFLYQHVDHVYVLNLHRRFDRFHNTRCRLNAAGIFTFERFFGEDCLQTKYSLLFSDYQSTKNQGKTAQSRRLKIPSAGSLCILYSMKAMLKDAIERGFSSILVLQDDLFLIEQFKERFIKSMRIIPHDWNLLYIGANDKVIKTRYTRDHLKPFYFPKGTSDGAFAIMVRASIFTTLLEHIDFTLPFDSGPLKSMQRLQPQRSVVLYPNLIIADVSDSDCRDSRNQLTFSERVMWDMHLYHTTVPVYQPARWTMVIIPTGTQKIDAASLYRLLSEITEIAGQDQDFEILVFCTNSQEGSRVDTSRKIRYYSIPEESTISSVLHTALSLSYTPSMYYTHWSSDARRQVKASVAALYNTHKQSPDFDIFERYKGLWVEEPTCNFEHCFVNISALVQHLYSFYSFSQTHQTTSTSTSVDSVCEFVKHLKTTRCVCKLRCK